MGTRTKEGEGTVADMQRTCRAAAGGQARIRGNDAETILRDGRRPHAGSGTAVIEKNDTICFRARSATFSITFPLIYCAR